MKVRYIGKCTAIQGNVFTVRAIVPPGELHPFTYGVNDSGQNEYICYRGNSYSYSFLEKDVEILPESKVIWL